MKMAGGSAGSACILPLWRPFRQGCNARISPYFALVYRILEWRIKGHENITPRGAIFLWIWR
jgi:hypothetical protein